MQLAVYFYILKNHLFFANTMPRRAHTSTKPTPMEHSLVGDCMRRDVRVVEPAHTF